MVTNKQAIKIVLADSRLLFREHIATLLGMAEDFRIVAYCSAPNSMYHALATFPGSIALFAASLQPELARL
ncbi:MAG: hypothetical protein ABSF53_13290, partial [Terracidiphilus sp.]